MAGCFPEKPRWCLSEQVCQGSVKCFERSSGLDTALYKNVPLLYIYIYSIYIYDKLTVLSYILFNASDNTN